AGKHILVLLNGHTVNETWGGWVWVDDLFTLPIEVLDRIEILNGPGSVLYGTSAMYGVINLVSKSAEAQEGLGVELRGQLALPGDENNALTGKTASSGSEGARLGWGSRARLGFALPFVVHDRSGEFFVQLMRVNRQAPTHVYGPQTPDWDPGPNHYPNGDWGGVGGARRWITGGMIGLRVGNWALDLQGGNWRREQVTDYQVDFADPHNLERWSEARLDLRHDATLRAGMHLRSRIFGDYYDYHGIWNYTDPAFCGGVVGRCSSQERNHSGRFGIEEVFEADWFVDGKVVTMIGGDVRGRALEDIAGYTEYRTPLGNDQAFLHYLAVTAAGALFVQQRVQPVRWFGLNVGLRLDMDQLFGAHLSPRAVASFTPGKKGGTVIQLGYAEAFRAPYVGELLFNDPNAHVSASSLGGLRPEIVRSGELAFEQRLPRGVGSLRLGAYLNWYRDLVNRRTLTSAEFQEAVELGKANADADPNYMTTYDNLGRMFAYGGYLSARLQTPDRRFRFGTNIQGGDSWQIPEQGAPRTPVAIAPRVTANAHAMFIPGGALPRPVLGLVYFSPRRTVEDVSGEFKDVEAARAGHHIQGRLGLSGEVPAAGLSWGLWADYTLARRGPYLVGQLTYSDGMAFPGELEPLDRLSLWASVSWQFDVVAAARRARSKRGTAGGG
ncbi:MAG: TonB-dependent receptor plug domain-containing protein, partial [Myxococcales bacterium]|nr:TonB-dependent receptor plug domain-containing protein [Myxococcales bacterium]